MTRALVGHTGFVGGNLARQTAFDHLYNSRNIEGIAGADLDLLVVSGVRASMWLANTHPEQDLADITALFERLATVKARTVVLISTIAVYADPAAAPDEASDAFETVKPYGRHRRLFELQLAARFPKLLTLRLPALFGDGLSKNFIYDLINPIPSFLPDAAFQRLLAEATQTERAALTAAFTHDANLGRWSFDRPGHGQAEGAALIEAALKRLRLDAPTFTDSANTYQFYNLDHLWADIERALQAGLSTLNLATQPLLAADIAQALTGQPFRNPTGSPAKQDMRTRYAPLWGRADGYLYGADQTLTELGQFYRRAKAIQS